MTNLTLIQSGSFVSTGANVTLNLRPGTNFMSVWNITAISTALASAGYKWEWNAGMGGIEYQANAGSNAVFILPRPNDFIAVDTSITAPLGPVAITGSSNVVRPIVTTASTAGLSAGSVVRLTNITAQPNLSGYDFGIDTIVANTSFRIAAALANGPGAAGTNGFYRIIPYNPIFYPSKRFVVNISQAATAQVTTSVAHNLTVGQAVRFYVSSTFGMTQIDQLIGDVLTIVDAYNFTVDIDTTAFNAFVFPAAAAYPFSMAQIVPVGEQADATVSDPNLLNDATVNTAILGMILVAGINSPAGQNGDTIYWQAGRTANF